ncbi:MAG: pyrroline-5-carboxylate reductase [Candidatus Sedimenticola endophacoides]
MNRQKTEQLPDLSHNTVSFIGGGNMAASLISGLVADGHNPKHILVSDPDSDKLAALAARYGIQAADNATAVSRADILILAVKPQVLQVVAHELAPAVQERRPLTISIAAGVRGGDIDAWLGGHIALVRAMPNTPAMIQAGATVLFTTPRVSAEQRSQAESILRAVGLTRWVSDEGLMDAVTALSGSGPAYFFLMMEAMEQAGVELGIPAETARQLTLQTALGAARMAIESSDGPARLRQKVTSPGGTTERALGILEQGGLRDLFSSALTGARDRSIELSDMLGAK